MMNSVHVAKKDLGNWKVMASTTSNQADQVNVNQKNEEEICFYASDVLTSIETPYKLPLRKVPKQDSNGWKNIVNYNHNLSVALKYDELNNIYYLPIGVKPHKISFKTPDYEWLQQYCIFRWAR